MRLWRRRQCDEVRRRRPCHERLIIAMTLVVGAVWLVSIFKIVRVELGGWDLAYRDGALYIGEDQTATYLRSLTVVSSSALHGYLDRLSSLGSARGTLLPSMSVQRPWRYLQVPSLLFLLALPIVACCPPALHTVHRRRKNRCIDCGYPRGEQLDRCPECGRLASQHSPGLRLLAWRAYRWPVACIAVNVAVTLVAIEIMN